MELETGAPTDLLIALTFLQIVPRTTRRRLIIDDTFPQTRRLRSQCHNVQSGGTAPKPAVETRVTSRYPPEFKKKPSATTISPVTGKNRFDR